MTDHQYSEDEALAGMPGVRPRKSRSVFAGVLPITIMVIFTVGTVAVLLNNRCQDLFRRDILVYPNADLQSEEWTFLARQEMVYFTTDEPEVVADWYRLARARAMRQAVITHNFEFVPPENWIIESVETGTTITFVTVCP